MKIHTVASNSNDELTVNVYTDKDVEKAKDRFLELMHNKSDLLDHVAIEAHDVEVVDRDSNDVIALTKTIAKFIYPILSDALDSYQLATKIVETVKAAGWEVKNA